MKLALAPLIIALLPFAATAQELPTKDQFYANEYWAKMATAGALLDEVHRRRAEIKQLTDDNEKLKAEVKRLTDDKKVK